MSRANHLRQYLLERKCRTTGFVETIVYTGSLRNKPQGWMVVKKVK